MENENKTITGTMTPEFQRTLLTVRAKVKCHEIVICEGWSATGGKDGKGGYAEARRFKMQIVNGTTEENRLYSAISGGTAVELQTINPLVFDRFKIGGEYYVDFIPAPDDPSVV